jgi:hypothetical protein
VVLLLISYVSYSQHHRLPDYAVKIKIDDAVYKGLLTGIMDSSIEIMNKKSRIKTIFMANQINLIKIKKPFLTNTTKDFAAGAGAGAVLVVAYYWKRLWKPALRDPADPTFGNALWTTMAFGAALGLVYGSIESLFVHKKLHINNALYIFENKRSKLEKYLYY